ncbi:MAG: glycine oxidase ThiO [Gammaproteobacteria bacterium]|nr:MAG: glycine oxidase ThiO [Gammaproteobacteria bacterium]
MRDPVVIAGAGVIGLALAFELQERGERVKILMPEDEAGTATLTAAGMLAPVSEADVEHTDLVPLALDSLARYPNFIDRVQAAAGRHCDYRTEGTLWVALHRDHRAELEHLLAFMNHRGLSAERLDARSLRRLEPGLSPRTVGGYRISADHQVDPRALRLALLEALTLRGAELESSCRAVGLECRGGVLTGIKVAYGDRQAVLPCTRAVLANGAWLGHDFDGALPDCGVRPVRGQVLRLTGPVLLQHVIRTPDVYLVPRADGRLVVGASSEERGFDGRNSAGATHDLLRHAIAAVPEIAELEIEEISVGFRPATRDHLPVIGATAVSGLFLCGGHFRNGVLLAPASAALLAETIHREWADAALAPFSPRRFEVQPCPNRN